LTWAEKTNVGQQNGGCYEHCRYQVYFIVNCTVSSYPILEQYVFQPNETKQLSFPADIFGYKQIELKLQNNNTIANYSKLKLKPDCTVYIELWCPSH
jgi:hypothetical protein